MKTQSLIAVAALCVGAAGGYLVGNSGTAEQTEPEESVRDTKSGRSGVGVGSGGAVAKPSRMRGTDEIYRLPGQMNRVQSLIDYYAGLDTGQLETEADKLEMLPPQQRMMAAFLLFSRWSEVDPLSAMAYSKNMGFTGMFVRPAVMQGWASVDPENAAQYYKDNPNEFSMMGRFGRGPMGGDSGAGVIAGEWARNDSDGAMAWAMTLEGGDRSSAIAAVLREMAASDPAAAADKLAGLAGEDLGRAYRDIAQQWAMKDWQSAKAWVSGLPIDEQGRAMSSAIEGLAKLDYNAAARELEAMPADQVDDDAVRAVSSAMTRNDPAAAAEWLAGLETDQTGGAMREAMMSWTSTDSAAALAFIQKQPEGELRDTAASTYVFSSGNASPRESMAVAETISDEGSRARAIGMTARRWMQDDEAAAKAYIESTTAIDDESKQRILEGGDDRGRGGPGGGRGGPGGGRGGR